MLDEEVSEDNPKEQVTKNKALNVKNKKWRDLFANFNDKKFLANCLGPSTGVGFGDEVVKNDLRSC